MSLLETLRATPAEVFLGDLVDRIKTESAEWVANTRHDLVDIDARLKRIDPHLQLMARRGARLAEWHMARRWPVNDDGVNRTDDRPPLGATKGVANDVAWHAVYTVGRCPYVWLIEQDDPDKLSQAKVIQHVVALERRPAPAVTPDLPLDFRFHTIVIDPPWPVTKIVKDARPFQGVELDYPTMSLDEIARLPVARLAEDDAHLYLWTTHKLLPDALELVDGWGFRYQCLLTWCKPTGAAPFSWLYDTEHCLFARRGDLDLLQMGLRLSIIAGRGDRAHSAKPDEFYDRVIAASPEPRFEMYARRPRSGFTVWGDEVAS
jgi:N6-adenosine-specific RNA methylase IME4